eukprot:TRINITY_DN13686_c0_g1_i2.p1 TRINITY_DN13686_c0_g1~~TRINITY_DN13686_c0_g1_i2.p1  ORF type:complete len:124 (-),score=18.03 TRINITY_DN13686_c0_g1_i2:42-413(-)
MGNVSGYVFQAPGYPTVYWIGDSIWCKEVQEAIDTFQPDYVITHSGGATFQGSGPIIMDIEQTLTTIKAAPAKATIISIHLESLDHCSVTREALRKAVQTAGYSETKVWIPRDGAYFELTPKN